MRVEGNRVPDFLDMGGVLRTVHRKPPRMSQADYLRADPVVNPNFDPSSVPVNNAVEVVEQASGVINDCSPEAMSDTTFNSHLEGDSKPFKAGFSEADYGVW